MKILTALAVVVFVFTSASVFATQPVTLDEAVNIALKDNRKLAAARLLVEEANARLVQAGLMPNPELELEGKLDTAFKSESKHTFSIGVVQPFSISNRIPAQKDVARIEIQRAVVEIADLERRIAGDARRKFIELLAIEEQGRLQASLIGLNDELLRAIKASLRRGLVSEIDVNTAQIALQQSRQKIKAIESQRSSRQIELNRLMGRPAEYDFIAKGSLEPQPLNDPSDFILEKALERRPDYIAAQLDSALARSEQRLTKAEQLDSWRIGLGYEREQGAQDGNAEHFIGLKLSFPLPLFDKKQGRILETTAKEVRAQKTAEALRLQISLELAGALIRVKTLASMIESYSPDILKPAEENVRLTEIGYSRGLTGIADVIQSKQQLADLRSSYVEMLKDYQMAVTDIEIAAGIFPSAIRKLSKEVIHSEK